MRTDGISNSFVRAICCCCCPFTNAQVKHLNTCLQCDAWKARTCRCIPCISRFPLTTLWMPWVREEQRVSKAKFSSLVSCVSVWQHYSHHISCLCETANCVKSWLHEKAKGAWHVVDLSKKTHTVAILHLNLEGSYCAIALLQYCMILHSIMIGARGSE